MTKFTMYSTVLIACLLASGNAFASHAWLQTRHPHTIAQGITSPIFQSPPQGNPDQQNEFGGGHSYRKHHKHHHHHSAPIMIKRFSDLESRITDLQKLVVRSRLTQSVVVEHMTRLASSFRSALSKSRSCGNCFSTTRFVSSISSTFHQFSSLMNTLKSNYGQSFQQIIAPFGGISRSFQSFFASASHRGVYVNGFVPQELGPLLRGVIPAFGHLNDFKKGNPSDRSSGSSSSSSSSASSKSKGRRPSNATNRFSSLGSQISVLQRLLTRGGLNRSLIIEHMDRLASSFQWALSETSKCGNCFTTERFTSTVRSVFYQFSSLMSTVRSNFGNSFREIIAPFGRVDNAFQSFFTSASIKEVSIDNFLPPQLGSLLGGVIPAFAHLNGFQRDYSGHRSSSSSFSSSISTTIRSFSNLDSQISDLYGSLMRGSLTQSIVTQRMSQLASSFQMTLSEVSKCGNCFQADGFTSSIISVFQKFNSLLASIQSNFGVSFPQIVAPFGQLTQSFHSFFQIASSSGISVKNIIPLTLPSILGNAIPQYNDVFNF